MGFFPEDQYDYEQDYPQLGTKHLKLLEKKYDLDLPISVDMDYSGVSEIINDILETIKRNNVIPEYPCNGNARITVGLDIRFMYETVVSFGEENASPIPYKSKRQKYNTHKSIQEPYKKNHVIETIEDILGAFDESKD